MFMFMDRFGVCLELGFDWECECEFEFVLDWEWDDWASFVATFTVTFSFGALLILWLLWLLWLLKSSSCSGWNVDGGCDDVIGLLRDNVPGLLSRFESYGIETFNVGSFIVLVCDVGLGCIDCYTIQFDSIRDYVGLQRIYC